MACVILLSDLLNHQSRMRDMTLHWLFLSIVKNQNITFQLLSIHHQINVYLNSMERKIIPRLIYLQNFGPDTSYLNIFIFEIKFV